MSRDDRPNPNDNLYVEMTFIGSLWKETGGLVESARRHLWDSVVGAKAKIRKLTILSNTFPKRGSWIQRDLSFYPDVCFAVFQIWETRNTNISQRYSRTSVNGHLPTTATFFRPGGQKSIHWLLFKTSLQRPLSCPQGGLCTEVGLYNLIANCCSLKRQLLRKSFQLEQSFYLII